MCCCIGRRYYPRSHDDTLKTMIQTIEQPDAAIQDEVRRYLATGPAGACGEHDPAWLGVLRGALGHRPYMLIARRAFTPGVPIDGYLPLALVASRLFGRFLVSLPYLNRAGVVANDPAIAAELIERGSELAAQVDAQYLELRHGPALEHTCLTAKREDKVRMVLQMPKDADTFWKGLDAKVRNLVRKGDKSELELQWGGGELVDAFYEVFAVNMRDLGTPVYSRSLFAGIAKDLPGAELAVVRHKGQPIAGALLVHSPAYGSAEPSSTQVPSASALREFNATSANMWMYHRLILRAMERGSAQFDFGRSSTDSGTFKFKKQWGAQPRPTVWQYHVRRGDIQAVRPDSPKYKRRIETWQKLPVWLTRLVGPVIVRGIP